MSEQRAKALAWWFITVVIGSGVALAAFLIWWPLLVYSWNYWFAAAP